jgi:hypothetical protein
VFSEPFLPDPVGCIVIGKKMNGRDYKVVAKYSYIYRMKAYYIRYLLFLQIEFYSMGIAAPVLAFTRFRMFALFLFSRMILTGAASGMRRGGQGGQVM